MAMKKGKSNWDKLQKQSATDSLRNRDVYNTQQMDRTKIGQKQSFTSRHIITICVAVVTALIVWVCYSLYDVKQLDNKAALDANVAVEITEQAPSEPRDLADVTWANMILVEDRTYSKFGYTYMDKRTGVKYTAAEYEIWLDVNRRISGGEIPELLRRANADGTYTYKERDEIAPPGDEPRSWTHAEILNFLQRGVTADACYADLGYAYVTIDTKGNKVYITPEEYETISLYTRDYINTLVGEGLVKYTEKEIITADGVPKTIYYFTDTGADAIVNKIPTENAGERYYTPILLDDLTWANMQLVADSAGSKFGFAYVDLRSGEYYTEVEYAKWKTIYDSAKAGVAPYSFWMTISPKDGCYYFEEKPSAVASDEPRDEFKQFITAKLIKMNLVKHDFWKDYGYNYYDYYTKMFYSDAEYALWLDVQNKVASGAIRVPKDTQTQIREDNIKVSQVVLDKLDPLPATYTFSDGMAQVSLFKVFVTFGIAFMVYAILKTILKKNLDAQNLMNDTSDINQYENDQHIALPEEVQRKFDWFPDIGAHCPVQVSSMISHMMLSNKGLNKITVAKRAEKDIVDSDGNVEYYKGEILCNADGDPITEMLPMIDMQFGEDLYEASGALKEVRKIYDANKIPYNPDGKDRTKQCGTHKTVADAINNTWEYPLYEPQRPAGAYMVDTEPVNTMVLAITRAGKGQTVIEPTIDMWTRETRPNNMVINDPKGELLVKNYVRGTVRGFQIVQFNLINVMKTDIYNPLGMAADAAREGDFTKCAMYVDNVASVFFPVDGADDPVWPNAANNAFKRAAYGLMDYYLEEEKELRREAERINLDPKILETKIDQMWGKVTLYNCYQLFVQLTSKKLKNPSIEFQANAKIAKEYIEAAEKNNTDISTLPPHPNPAVQAMVDATDEEYDAMLNDCKCRSELWEDKPETDLLSLFFSATDQLPRNSMRNLVSNANNALKSMAGAEKMLASVYGIAITAMVRHVSC